MTQTFTEGDLVEAVKGTDRISGLVTTPPDRTHAKMQGKCLHDYESEGWTLTRKEKALPPLPTEPGTVIAIGEWWLVKLRGYDTGAQGGWEFLPVPRSVKPSVDHSGQKDQCVYSNDWVRAEVEQEGGFVIISQPVATTAVEVLGRLREQGLTVTESRDAPYLTIDLDRLDVIAAEYGVTK